MQTFLPYPSFLRSAQCLDRARLGKMRIEAWQILQTLLGKSAGWRNHPAVKMWAGHELALCRYGWTICQEWIARGYRDTMFDRFDEALDTLPDNGLPLWWEDERLHGSHRAALLAKAPEHYSQFNWSETPAIDYYWPTKEG